MAEPQRGMGRGLAAILAVAPRDEPEELRELPIEAIGPNPRQPRRQFDEEQLLTLAGSIRVRGVIQPVLVRPDSRGQYQLIAGERRWRAAQMADLERLPAIVRHDDDAASLELALIENMAREDLNPVEEARACAALVEELGLTREEVGLRVGRSRVAVSNLLRLLELPDEVLAMLEDAQLSEGHGRALLLNPEHSERRSLARRAVSERWSVRELERRARHDGGTAARSSSPPEETHPDRQEAIDRIADSLGSALGSDLEVRATGSGYSVRLSFRSVNEALELAKRLGSTA